MARKAIPTKSDIVLGKKIKELRVNLDMSQMQLGRKVNELCQQIDKYEDGARIAITKLEDLAEVLGIRIPKKTIRRIVIARKIEIEDGIDQQEELIALYNQAFATESDEDGDG